MFFLQLSLNSRRICAIRISNDNFKLLLIDVYMPYENQDDTTDDFADQVFIIETLINDNSDYHFIVGGDFNVDFSRNRIHIAMLSSFCTNLSLTPAVHYVKNAVTIYTYNFNLSRFGI